MPNRDKIEEAKQVIDEAISDLTVDRATCIERAEDLQEHIRAALEAMLREQEEEGL